jgi:hypothetical protein
MNGALSLLLLVLSPLVLGLILGLLQWAVYRALVRAGRIPGTSVPFFPVLCLRGMVVVVAIGALLAIIQSLSSG